MSLPPPGEDRGALFQQPPCGQTPSPSWDCFNVFAPDTSVGCYKERFPARTERVLVYSGGALVRFVCFVFYFKA